ncbi:MAG: hypothetical protein Pg6B_07140 [Candidatus Azobacteroides pseudotrichonymphae]|nr:MAG: hypothetical protein Pg6B_07140 [Candidatus Azobacteroides pseudotrichonymphae]
MIDELKRIFQNKNKKETWVVCEKLFGIVGVEMNIKGDEIEKEGFLWRGDRILSKKGVRRAGNSFSEN